MHAHAHKPHTWHDELDMQYYSFQNAGRNRCVSSHTNTTKLKLLKISHQVHFRCLQLNAKHNWSKENITQQSCYKTKRKTSTCTLLNGQKKSTEHVKHCTACFAKHTTFSKLIQILSKLESRKKVSRYSQSPPDHAYLNLGLPKT